ncbi:MAG: hypothetical protein E7103_14350 [Prevotella sp.]|nr:hypothetical protein [Prevotella sp.]
MDIQDRTRGRYPFGIQRLPGEPYEGRALKYELSTLNRNPAKTSFEQLVKLMVEHDIAKVVAEGAASKVRTNLA